MTKKVPKKIVMIERNFFVNLRKTVFGRPRRAAADFFDRRRAAAADRNCPARRRRHNDVGAQLYLECTTMLPVFEKREVVTGWRHPWFVYHKQSILVA